MTTTSFRPDFSFLVKPMELAAIWLTKSVLLGDGRKTVRITKGDKICWYPETGLQDCFAEPTHVIEVCYGTPNSNFSIFVKSLEDGSLSFINL